MKIRARGKIARSSLRTAPHSRLWGQATRHQDMGGILFGRAVQGRVEVTPSSILLDPSARLPHVQVPAAVYAVLVHRVEVRRTGNLLFHA